MSFRISLYHLIESNFGDTILVSVKNNSQLIFRIILILGDFLALTAAFSVAYILRVKFDTRPLIAQVPAETYLYAILIVLPLWIIIHGAIGLYTRSVYENRFSELGKLILGSILGILTVIGYDFVIDDDLFPARLVVVYGFLLSLGFLVVFRTLARLTKTVLYSYGVGITNLVIVGDGKSSIRVIDQFANTSDSGHRIVGIVGESKYDDIPNFASIEDLEKKYKTTSIDSIIQTKLYKDDQKNNDVLAFAQKNHIEYRFIPANSELFSGNLEVELYREVPLITVHQTALFGWGQVVKRIFDLLFGGLVFIFLLPLLLIVAALQKIVDPNGSILLKQTRLTKFNKEFTVYKFRSHKSKYNGLTPEEAFKQMGKPELAKLYRENGDHLENDPRISGFGKFIRVTSIDELPQLINVLRGDISLVGPRALIPQELDKYHQKHHILSVKSGMTGLAQVSGRRNISFEERRKLDVYYVQNWSFWLDLIILLRTLRAVIGGSGAK